MINLIYLCFNAKVEEKKVIYEVLINSDAITNFCQESVKPNLCLELNYKLQGIDVFDNKKLLYEKLISNSNKICDYPGFADFYLGYYSSTFAQLACPAEKH